MGKSFVIVHAFPCDPKTYWDVFWDESFNEEQYRRTRCQRTVLSVRDEDNRVVRDQEIRPERSLSGPMAKLLGKDGLRYIEHTVFQKPLGPAETQVKVPALGERFSLRAEYTVRETGPGQCERTLRGECNVQIPLLGGRIADLVIDQLKESYETTAAVHREWIAKGATGGQDHDRNR